MRILLFLLLSITGYSQQLTFSKLTFDALPVDSTVKYWSRTTNVNTTVTIDSIGKRLIIPKWQIFSNASIKRNLMTDLVISQITDTTVMILTGTEVLNMRSPYIVNKPAPQIGETIKIIYLQNGMSAYYICGSLFVLYPTWSKYIRGIEFRN